MRLPIDLVSNTVPPKFKWNNLNTHCTGSLPAGVDTAVAALIRQHRALLMECEELRRQLTESQVRTAVVQETEQGQQTQHRSKRGK